ncbi:hypothetical protein LCGC14_1318220 [marine sediment metagenome]|uniref:Uncharacterized protein n=1 Tax=marine sediment metagenome TaxID=412755 RepID=A0A0F9N169_9ZZZZ
MPVDLPDPSMLSGDTQEVMSYVILLLITAVIALFVYHVSRQSKLEAKFDKLQKQMIKQIARSNRAMEAVAKLPPPKEDYSDDQEEN